MVTHWLTFDSSARAERSLAYSVMSSQGTLCQQGSGPTELLKRSEMNDIGLVEAPESVHVLLEDRVHTTRTLSNADTITALPAHPRWNV